MAEVQPASPVPQRSGRVFAAVDIGASGGRVMAGVVTNGTGVELHTVHRFANAMHEADGHLRWDIRQLYREVLVGLTALAGEFPDVESIGIDTWAVDYGLLDAEGELLADPVAYRDDRTADVIDDVLRLIGPSELYSINGLQQLPFTTLYQLVAEQRGPLWDRAAHAVLLPDLLAYWLTGELATEYTNASTTGLIDVRERDWSTRLTGLFAITPTLFPPLQHPGAVRGTILQSLAADLGLRRDTVVTTVGSHDTASAVVGVPATSPDVAFVASGTWSLVGLELDAPVVTEASRAANFTNEAGVGGRTRFLRNVGGLWLLQESIRSWAEGGAQLDLAQLLLDAAPLVADAPVIDVDDPTFIARGDMPDRIVAAVAARELPVPSNPAEFVACIVESLAVGYARTVAQAAAIADRRVDVIHLVGGGSQNTLLCERTAIHAARPVVAGPVEATALGNVCVQAMSRGALPDDLDEVRRILAADARLTTYRTTTYQPFADQRQETTT